MTRRLPLFVLVVACVSVFATGAASSQKRPITEKDIFDFTWIGDVQLAPDGRTIALVETSVTPDHSGYQSSLYLLDLTQPNAQPVRLTAGTHDGSPRWSPDSRQLAFVRSVEKDGRTGSPQLYLMTPNPKASPVKLTELPKGVGSPQWMPSGVAIAVTSSTPRDPDKAKREAMLKGRATGDDAHTSDVRIIDRAAYRSNGEGYTDATMVPQVYLVSLPKPDGTQDSPWQLTGGRFGVQEYFWEPGASRLFYTSNREDEAYYDAVPHNTLYGLEVPLSTPRPKEPPSSSLTYDFKTLEARGLAMSRDGRHLAFHATVLPIPPATPVSHKDADLFVLDLKPGKNGPTVADTARNLTAAKGFEMGGGVGGDNTAPRGGGRSAITWSADGKTLLDSAGSQGSALLLSIDVDSGEMTRLTARQQAVLSFVATPDTKTVVALISNPILIGDLFRIDPMGTPAGPHSGTAPAGPGNQTQLTHVNDALFAQLDIAMPRELHVVPTVRADDIPFLSIDTFVELPPGFVEGRKYPLILNIHGGPHSAYGWVFDHEMLWMAAQGYVVDYPNPRGSTTYGDKFANVIESNYPGDDFHDLMDTVDAIVAKGWADPAKLGVTGGSGGGLLTDWTVTQTDRFKAAVAQRDIVDQAAWWYTADISEFHQYWMAEAPFDHVELYKAHSPLTFVNNVKTPMMFILGEADYRTPPTSGGEEFFRALKYKCIPAVMVRFPRESHELSRSGEPWHRVERLENIVDWFDLWLKNEPQPQYNTARNPACQNTVRKLQGE